MTGEEHGAFLADVMAIALAPIVVGSMNTVQLRAVVQDTAQQVVYTEFFDYNAANVRVVCDDTNNTLESAKRGEIMLSYYRRDTGKAICNESDLRSALGVF